MMKNSLEVLLAGSLGLVAIVGVITLRKVLKEKTYTTEYTDTHNIFIKTNDKISGRHGDGIEINAMM